VFEKLKRAVRASRKRSRDYRTTQRKVGIDLDHAAHLHLPSLADELGMSLSDTVLLLEDSYWKAQKAGIF
jgi:macrodomain Ter protein organizer (MatP/YcbG family)